jgi:hypothetical protein
VRHASEANSAAAHGFEQPNPKTKTKGNNKHEGTDRETSNALADRTAEAAPAKVPRNRRQPPTESPANRQLRVTPKGNLWRIQ